MRGADATSAELARAEMTEALNRGGKSRDSRVAMLLQQERAGIKIEVAEAERLQAVVRDGSNG